MQLLRKPFSPGSLTHPAPSSALAEGNFSAIAIGNFDGVHLGHAALLQALTTAAKAEGLIPTVLTFHPHPRDVLYPHQPLPAITTLRDRLALLKSHAIQRCCLLPFNARMATLSAEAFVETVLHRQLQARMVWVGPDFRFGAGRKGTIDTLQTLGQQYGFTVHTQPVVQLGGHKVSSSAIRQALAQGDVPAAQRLLGHPLVYSGHVVHGQKLGRTLGFPTLNLRINSKASALGGVLAVRVHGLEGAPINGVACLGLRPTVVNSTQLLLETYLPHWPNAHSLYGHDPIDHRQHPENAYGRCIAVEVVAHLRPEQHFAKLEDMVEQMHQDTEAAMALLHEQENRLDPTNPNNQNPYNQTPPTPAS